MGSWVGAGHKKDQTMIRSLELSTTPLTHPSGRGEGLEMEVGTNVASIQAEDAGRSPRLHSVVRTLGKTTLDVCAASLHPWLPASVATTTRPAPCWRSVTLSRPCPTSYFCVYVKSHLSHLGSHQQMVVQLSRIYQTLHSERTGGD